MGVGFWLAQDTILVNSGNFHSLVGRDRTYRNWKQFGDWAVGLRLQDFGVRYSGLYLPVMVVRIRFFKYSWSDYLARLASALGVKL